MPIDEKNAIHRYIKLMAKRISINCNFDIALAHYIWYINNGLADCLFLTEIINAHIDAILICSKAYLIIYHFANYLFLFEQQSIELFCLKHFVE